MKANRVHVMHCNTISFLSGERNDERKDLPALCSSIQTMKRG